jgi:hypothetical protein
VRYPAANPTATQSAMTTNSGAREDATIHVIFVLRELNSANRITTPTSTMVAVSARGNPEPDLVPASPEPGGSSIMSQSLAWPSHVFLTLRGADIRLVGMSDERSESGAPVYRHTEAVEGDVSYGDGALSEAVVQHVSAHLGEPANVLHELVSPYVHVDIHVVDPTEDAPWFTLVTSGMSERAMTAPDGGLRYAELMLQLPPRWPGLEEDAATGREEDLWPLTLMQDLARLPHQFDTLLWAGHTVPNGDPPSPYARGTKLCGALLLRPATTPEEFDTLRFGDHEISFFAVYPLHAGEMQHKLAHGVNALAALFDDAEVTELLDTQRPSVVPGRRGLFRRR